MRLCRLQMLDRVEIGFYDEDRILLVQGAAAVYADATGKCLSIPWGDNLLDMLPPDGPGFTEAVQLFQWVQANRNQIPDDCYVSNADAEVLLPIPKPGKILLLAGNYVDHIIERGYMSTERKETFPYVFMKPPSTTLRPHRASVSIPKVSPNAIDWELELAVVIGRQARHVPEAEALKYVAGYTVINDLSDRKYKPFPDRKKRERDSFFDWLHGKWHDGFCPCGPCIVSADEIPDPQTLGMKLHVNDDLKQNGNTGQQVFPVAAVVEFVSQLVTLQPGDIISTGTPAGVGSSTGTFLKPGDVVRASIDGIGTLVTTMTAEE